LFGDADDWLYRDWLGIAAAKAGAEIWTYCLMPTTESPARRSIQARRKLGH
jgi:hypothetical protein